MISDQFRYRNCNNLEVLPFLFRFITYPNCEERRKPFSIFFTISFLQIHFLSCAMCTWPLSCTKIVRNFPWQQFYLTYPSTLQCNKPYNKTVVANISINTLTTAPSQKKHCTHKHNSHNIFRIKGQKTID